MKFLLLALFLPLFSSGQTIHFDDDKIIYKGSISFPGSLTSDMISHLQVAALAATEKSNVHAIVHAVKDKVVTKGKIKLNSPFHLIRMLHFTLQVQAGEGTYEYQIDSVFVTEKRRGGSEKTKSSKELLEGIEDTGTVAIETERLLNEIDMRLQKLLAILKAQVKSKDQ